MPALNGLAMYYAQIGAAPATISRVDELLALHAAIFGGAPEYVFLEDIVTSDGNRQFTNLGCISNSNYVDMKIPTPNWYSNISPIDGLTTIAFRDVEAFDFTTANPSSRLTVELYRYGNKIGHFHSTGQNCLELSLMIRTYFVPKLSA